MINGSCLTFNLGTALGAQVCTWDIVNNPILAMRTVQRAVHLLARLFVLYVEQNVGLRRLIKGKLRNWGWGWGRNELLIQNPVINGT